LAEASSPEPPAGLARLPRPPRRAVELAHRVSTFLRVLAANPLSLIGFILVVLLVGAAAIVHFDPHVLPYGPTQQTTSYNVPPSILHGDFQPKHHLFGTDELGHDVFSNVLLALPLDLGIGISIAGIALLVGGALGLVAGFWDRPGTLGGASSVAILRLTDIFLSFPSLVLALAITATLGRGIEQVEIAILATWWPYYVRLVRGEVLAVKHQPFVTAARAAGVHDVRILFRHIVRNVLEPLVVYFTMDIGTVLVTFSTISFVANGIPYPGPTPEWGSMIEFYKDNLSVYPWTVLFPGAAVFVTVLAFSLLGDGLRDVLDPRSRRAFVRAAAPSTTPPEVPSLPPVPSVTAAEVAAREG
jgi:peptide/nickel transport system permease protein